MNEINNENIQEKANQILLQEKLSQYLDIIEISLIQEINKRSDSFFNALQTFQYLHYQVTETYHHVEKIRNHLKNLHENIVKKSKNIIYLQKKKNFFIDVHKKVIFFL